MDRGSVDAGGYTKGATGRQVMPLLQVSTVAVGTQSKVVKVFRGRARNAVLRASNDGFELRVFAVHLPWVSVILLSRCEPEFFPRLPSFGSLTLRVTLLVAYMVAHLV